MSGNCIRSDFEIVCSPRNEAERIRADLLVLANPEAFSGHALAEKAVHLRHEKQRERQLVEAFQAQFIHQANRLYEFGGYTASGQAWAISYEKTLADFDNVAKRHNLEGEEKERAREIIEQLNEISDKKLENSATDADFRLERELKAEAMITMPTLIDEIGKSAEQYDQEAKQALDQSTLSHSQENNSAINELETDMPTMDEIPIEDYQGSFSRLGVGL